MQSRHHVSAAAIELIKRFEGYRRSAAQLPDGRWTIGYGHTRSAREGARVSEDDASALLLYDLGEVLVVLGELVFTPLSQNQFDALASFAMNVGVEDFRTSEVLLRVNEGVMLEAAAAIEAWRKADFEGERIVVDSLVRRRAAEKALFLTPTEGYVPTPTPVVRPRFDDLFRPAPLAEAVVLTASLEGAAVVERESPPAGEPIVEAPETTLLEIAARAEALQEPVSTPPPEIEPLPDPSFHARRAQDDMTVDPFPGLEIAEVSAEAEPRRFDWAGFDAARRSPASYAPLALMLIVGMALLAVATYWFVHAHPRMGPVAPSIIGWVLGLTGIGLLATSIYFLLERFGQDEDEH
jgi:lysozyme